MLHLLATFFGTGRARIAPGTMTSLAAAALLLAPFGSRLHGIALGIMIVASYIACVLVARSLFGSRVNDEDPSWFTLDEAHGMWLAAWRPTPPTWAEIGIAFALFRFFDIVKPWPIRGIQSVRGGHGIVLDDTLAGAFALILGLCLRTWIP